MKSRNNSIYTLPRDPIQVLQNFPNNILPSEHISSRTIFLHLVALSHQFETFLDCHDFIHY